MTLRLVLLSALSAMCGLVASGEEEPHFPFRLSECLNRREVKGVLAVSTTRNPFYLRGDFNGDGQPDYAVEVTVVRSKKRALLICQGGGGSTVLGGNLGAKRPFSDKLDDDFISPDWEVMSFKDVNELTKLSANVPKRVLRHKGDAIAMLREDGISLVYWDGAQYRWAPSQQ